MPATTIITRNAPPRFRGLLASCACEIAPGVFVAPKMSRAVRERVCRILESWFPLGADYSIILTWPDPKAPGGLNLFLLGTPPYEVVDHFGFALTRTDLTEADRSALTTEDEIPF